MPSPDQMRPDDMRPDHTRPEDTRAEKGVLPFASLDVAMRTWPRGPMRILYVLVGVPLLVVIKLYKAFLSPLLPPSCRYSPSCSAYGFEAVSLHGPFKGGWLAVTRISRCHPWHDGGFDPVPGSALAARFVMGDDGRLTDTHDDEHRDVREAHTHPSRERGR